jgi:hypothetical protein
MLIGSFQNCENTRYSKPINNLRELRSGTEAQNIEKLKVKNRMRKQNSGANQNSEAIPM